MTEKRCSRHEWRRLFDRIPDGFDVPTGVAAAALGQLLTARSEKTICVRCGALGNGREAIRCFGDGREAELRAEAAAWNERLRAALSDTAPAATGRQAAWDFGAAGVAMVTRDGAGSHDYSFSPYDGEADRDRPQDTPAGG